MNVDELLRLIQQTYAAGQHDQAMAYFTSLDAKLASLPAAQSDRLHAQIVWGRTLLDGRSHTAAERVLTDARQLTLRLAEVNPQSLLSLRLALGDLYFRTERYDPAEREYRWINAQALCGQVPELKVRLTHKFAVLNERKGHYDAAVSGYEDYLRAYAQLHGTDKTSVYQETYVHKEKLRLALSAKRSGFAGPMMTAEGLIQGSFARGGGVLMDRQTVEELLPGFSE